MRVKEILDKIRKHKTASMPKAEKKKKKKKNDSIEEDPHLFKLVYFFFGGYLLIYVFFLSDGIFPAGPGLEKKDWLSFLGNYLSFAATFFVCAFSLYQNIMFRLRSEKQQKENRFNQIQPIFSIEITTNDRQRFGCEEDHIKDSKLVLKEFRFKIKNLGTFPALHIRIFDFYFLPVLGPGETTEFSFGYNIKTHVRVSSCDILCPLSVGDSEEKPPANMNVEYYDVDGNSMFQGFQLFDYRDRDLYLLTKKDKL